LRQAIRSYLLGKDLATISLKALRRDLEQSLNVGPGGFDARKDEIRQVAQEMVQAAQAAQAEATQQAEVEMQPPQKRRKSLLAEGKTPESGTVEAGGKAAKRKMPPSAYSLWKSENHASVSQALENQLERKPTFGEVCKAVSERWKTVAEADKALFEEKAKLAKAQLAADGPAAAPAPAKKVTKNSEGKGRGKGKGKGKRSTAPEGSLTRAAFLSAGPPLRCVLTLPPGSSTEETGLHLPPMDMAARLFKSGGAGWHSSLKFELTIAGQQVTVSANMVCNVSGSKHWHDGEGLSDMADSVQPAEPEDGEEAEASAVAVHKLQEVPGAELLETSEQTAKEAGPLEEQPSAAEAEDAEAPPGEEVAAAELPADEVLEDKAGEARALESEVAVEAHAGA